MRGFFARGVLVPLLWLASCGDNAAQCGDGTQENGDNICVPIPGQPTICGDGTVLDPLTHECRPDPTVCGGGTVLINDRCVDPGANLIVDLEEGPEPNGFEPTASLAGTITLPASTTTGFVIHGCVAPVDNNSPDFDVYQLTVTAPTLIKVTADGVGGLAAGFIALGDDPSLSSWFRLGLNITSDTSKRQLFLPVAGTYELVITDTRTLLPITQNGEGAPAAGNPDGTSCYYVTVTRQAIPNPTTITLPTSATGTISEDLKFFTAAFPTGITALTAVIDPEDLDNDGVADIDSRAASSLILIDNGSVRQINDAGQGFPATTPVSRMIFGGIKAGDVPIVLLDYVWNMTAFPADFRIDVNAALTSQALATDGSVVTATSKGQNAIDAGGSLVFDNINLFHFDVAAANEIDGMDITFSIPVQGGIVEQEGSFASPFTGLTTQDTNGSPTVNTFTAYKGLLRNTTPGRYYFFVFAPRSAVGSTFTVTSTIVPQTPDTVALDTPTASTPVNAFRSNALTYNAGTEPWQLFGATGTNTGSVLVSMFDPTNTLPQSPGFAFGRLDTLQTTFNSNPPITKIGDGVPLIAFPFVGNGSDPRGRILKNPLSLIPAATTNFLVKVNPGAPAASPAFVLDFATRIYQDFGGPAIPAGQTKNDNGTITAGSEERYYFETVPGNVVTITVTPTAPLTLDATLLLLDTSETAINTINSSIGTGAETLTYTQGPSGFTAFKVRGSGVTVGNFSVSVQVVAGPYTLSATQTAFSSACLGGTAVTLVGGFDEGLSAPIAAPAGFKLFGAAVTNFVVSSNGFISFNTAIPNAGLDNENIPDGIGNVNIAPYDDDLEVTVCKKTIGNKLVVQWDGDDFLAPVHFQAILDSTDNSIEFVYGAMGANGSSATIGLQDQAGAAVEKLGFDQPIVTSNSSIKLTPN